MNLSSGRVYYTQNPDDRIPPATITKVLTLYLVREAMARGQVKPGTLIPVSSAAVHTGGHTCRNGDSSCKRIIQVSFNKSDPAFSFLTNQYPLHHNACPGTSS
jgi:D-alanyl-D-alanine carboxypeptidase